MNDALPEYGILLVSRSSKVADLLSRVLPPKRYSKIVTVPEERAVSMEEKMVEIRIVNRAKCLLIEQLRMTEEEAHRYIEKQAMDRCVTKRTVAENILSTYK